jgi:SecD/SecF fusion protein
VRRYHLITLVIVALLGAVAALAVTRSPVLGLDLQGGLEVVFEAKAPEGEEVTDEGLDRAVEIMRSRVDRFGVAEPEIRKQPPNQIAIELAGVSDPERAAELIGSTAQLQFYDLEGNLVTPSIDTAGFPVASETLYEVLKAEQPRLSSSPAQSWYLFDQDEQLIGGPEATQELVLAELEGGESPEGSEFLGLPEDRIVITCGPESAVVCPNGAGGFEPTQTYYYLFEYRPTDPEDPVPQMTGGDLKSDNTRQDYDQLGQPVVLMEFTDEGGDTFHDITRELADRGRIRTGQLGSSQPVLQHFAIVLDGEIRSWPSIDFNENPDGISGGRAQITGMAGVDEAKDLAVVLQTGALPYTFEQVDRSDVSATLGKDSLREALIALVGGIAAVALVLLAFYRFLGIVAILGLIAYGALLYGAILLFGVRLTLPGFAGIVLTIGVAADANVVIFERIKEEVRGGKSVRAAIATGYRKGFSTIVDANVVTMITAFVLFAVGTGGPKGFALMLLIGTVISMFTAVAVTRALLGLLSGVRWFDSPSFMGATAQELPRWQRIDVNSPKRRRIWLSIATGLIVLSIILLATKGLNLGIDFKGGSQVTFQTPTPMSVERVREVASDVVPASAIVQGRGESTGDNYSSFQIRTESLTPEEQSALENELTNTLEAEAIGIRTVSGSFSSQILRNALIAVVVSFVLIAVYITFRFQWRFAVPILRTLFNDVLITLGVYSLSGRQVTASTVAAVLTVLGYSIYDTIIVFDRVRENMPLMRKSSFVAIANQSVWETLRRSLTTSFITLLPVVSLFLFGGDTLKDFAFALMVGIALGAVSTIFVATPFLTVLMERTPEYAPLRGQDEPVGKELEEEPAAQVSAGVSAAAMRRRLRRGAEGGEAPVAVVDAGGPDGAEHELEPTDGDTGGPVPLEPLEDGVETQPVPADAAARREARRKRRRSRPHGRAR